MAEGKLASATALLRAGRYSDAYYVAGYAAELLLKAVAAKRIKAGTIPEKSFVPNLYTHNLTLLVNYAELEAALRESRALDPEFGARWEIVAG
jgi:HEPN domain-containing protein